MGWSEDNLMLNFVGAVFLSVVVLFFEVIGKNLPPQKQARAAKWPLSSNRHCLCCTPPTRLHPPVVTACSNVLWASFAAQSWRFHQSNDKSDSFIRASIIVCSCQTSFVDPSLLHHFCCSAPRAPSRHTLTPRHAQSPYFFKDQPFQESARHSPPSSWDFIAHDKRDHITLGHTFFRYPGLALFFSAEGGRRHTCRQLSPCATYTATSVGLSTRYPDFTFNIKKNQTSNSRITEPDSAAKTPILE